MKDMTEQSCDMKSYIYLCVLSYSVYSSLNIKGDTPVLDGQ